MTIFTLSVPPSANAMYYNVAGAGRRKTRQYQAWICGELKALLAQRAKPFDGQAEVSISLPKIRGDGDNRIKPVLDLLVRAGVLKDDRQKYVSGVSLGFHDDSPMMRVEISTAKAVAQKGRAA